MRALTNACYFLKLSRPRTWSFAITLFVFAYLSSGPVHLSSLVIGILVCAIVTAMTNALNIYTDQAEDRINLPKRQEMLEAIGTRVFLAAVVAGYLLAVFAGAWVGVTFAIAVLVGVVDSVFYSWGPRLKAHPLLSLFAFSGAAVMPFVAGWVISRPLSAISPIIFVLGYSFFVYGNVKNIPDARGDRSAGVRTLFTIFSYYKGVGLVAILLTSPFLMLYVFIIVGWLDTRYAISFVFSPVIVYIVYRALVAQTQEEREATHALGYFYQLIFFLVTLSVYYFSIYSALASVAILAFSASMDYFKIDSRPYDLRLARLLGVRGAFSKDQPEVLGSYRDLYLNFDQTLDLDELYSSKASGKHEVATEEGDKMEQS
ncbi:MAG: prenyltransferase [Chloroflexi bacterium]|nr:prenyltransferase [Chloroflexota bacterium]